MTRILIADDVAQNRYLLMSLLKGNGYEVLSAGNGSEALELALRSPPDLVVTDILMPVMDGFELCRRWKADGRLVEIPLVFYTATYTEPKDEQFAMSLGADRFLVKPQRPERLLEVVREVLDEARECGSARPMPLGEEMEVLRQHNRALFRKLERKVAQLQAEKERLSALMNSIGEEIWFADRRKRFVLVNPRGLQELGLDPNDEIDVERLAASIEVLRPDGSRRPIEEAPPLRALRGEILRNHEEIVRIPSSGQLRHRLVSSTPVRDASDAIIGSVSVVRDITELKRTEARAELLSAMLDEAPVSVVVHDASGTILFANQNACSMHGYEPEEFLRCNLRDLVVPEERPLFAARVQEIARAEEATFDARHRRRDGATIPLHVHARTAEWEGRPAILSVQTDLTEHIRAEDERTTLEKQLQASQRLEAIGRLAGGIAHDFNNLLSVILSYTDFALEATRGEARVQEDLGEVRGASVRAAALVRQLLAFSRRQMLDPKPLDLNKVAAEVERMLRRILGEDIDLVQRLAPDLGQTLADPSQIEQVLMNLVVNARDAMPEGGTLTIETANVEVDEDLAAFQIALGPGPYVMLAVSDTGCGMDEQTRARIFEPFFTTKEKDKGTGLGLSTVYGIVRQSGGDVSVYSEPGVGTTFKIFLPRQERTSPASTKPPAAPGSSTGDETVLVVEDEDAVRNLAKRILEAAGYVVLVAASGSEALEICATHPGAIHLVLTDVVMPGMGGKALAAQLGSVRPALRILYMSGYTDGTIVRHGALDLDSRFINKPFNASDLARKVREALDRG